MAYGKGIAAHVPTLTWQPEPPLAALIGRSTGVGLDLGAGGRRLAPWIRTVDFVASPQTDIVADITREIPVDAGSADLVVATGVLEHVADEVGFLTECARLLKPGGTLYLEVPFMQQYHDDPIDVRRYTKSGLALRLEQAGFEIRDSGVHIGPTVTILTLSSYWWALIFEGWGMPGKVLGHAAFAGFSLAAWPLKFLDRWMIKKPSAHRLAFGVYCTAVKRG